MVNWKNSLCAALLAGAAMTPAFAADPVLSVSASPSPVAQGSSVSLSVLIADVIDLYGFQFSLSFNPALLQATSVSEGSFLGTGGSTFFGAGSINNTTGTIDFTFDTLQGAVPGVSGAGTLASISFSAVGAGTTSLTFGDVLLLNSSLADITTTVTNGSLTVTPVPEPATYVLFALGLAAVARRRMMAA
jgi:opacity protein-like surface antigen